MEDLEEMKSMFSYNKRNEFEVYHNAEDEMNSVTNKLINFIHRMTEETKINLLMTPIEIQTNTGI